MNCPKCKSDNTRKFQIVYEEGFYEGESQHHSTSYSGNNAYPTSTTTKTQGMTKLAERCAPPKKKSPFLRFFITNIVGGAFCFLFSELNKQYNWIASLSNLTSILWGVYFIFFVLSLKLFMSGFQYNKNEHPHKRKNWLNSWICMKCGHEYHFEMN